MAHSTGSPMRPRGRDCAVAALDASSGNTPSVGGVRKTPGITDVRITPEHNRVNILYDSHDKKDFRKIAKYAGLKLSYQLKSETFEIQLENENDKTPEYSVMVKNGQVIRENRVSRRKPD